MNGFELWKAMGDIDERFLELAEKRPQAARLHGIRRVLTFAAVLILMLALGGTAYAVRLFNSLDGDDLSFRSHYEGRGIVTIEIENRADVELRLQEQLELRRWSTGELVPRRSDKIRFSGTRIPPHGRGTMTIDLSDAYVMAALERPLPPGDWYYFVLTNNWFQFGQDWHCSVSFSAG